MPNKRVLIQVPGAVVGQRQLYATVVTTLHPKTHSVRYGIRDLDANDVARYQIVRALCTKHGFIETLRPIWLKHLPDQSRRATWSYSDHEGTLRFATPALAEEFAAAAQAFYQQVLADPSVAILKPFTARPD